MSDLTGIGSSFYGLGSKAQGTAPQAQAAGSADTTANDDTPGGSFASLLDSVQANQQASRTSARAGDPPSPSPTAALADAPTGPGPTASPPDAVIDEAASFVFHGGGTAGKAWAVKSTAADSLPDASEPDPTVANTDVAAIMQALLLAGGLPQAVPAANQRSDGAAGAENAAGLEARPLQAIGGPSGMAQPGAPSTPGVEADPRPVPQPSVGTVVGSPGAESPGRIAGPEAGPPPRTPAASAEGSGAGLPGSSPAALPPQGFAAVPDSPGSGAKLPTPTGSPAVAATDAPSAKTVESDAVVSTGPAQGKDTPIEGGTAASPGSTADAASAASAEPPPGVIATPPSGATAQPPAKAATPRPAAAGSAPVASADLTGVPSAGASARTPRDGSGAGSSRDMRQPPAERGSAPTTSQDAADAAAAIAGVAAPPLASPVSAGQQVAAALSGLLSNATAAAETDQADGPTVSGPVPPGMVAGKVAMSADGGREIVIRLDPEHLGSVSIRLKMNGQKVDVSITVANSRTLDLLNQDRHLLTGAVSSLGLDGDPLVLVGEAGDRSPSPSGTGPGGSDTGPRSGSGSAGFTSGDPAGAGRNRRGQERMMPADAPEADSDDPAASRSNSNARLGGLYV